MILNPVLLGMLVAGAVCQAATAEDEVIALERAALERWGRGDPQAFLDLYAPEMTYFDPYQPLRLDGVAALERLYAPLRGKLKIARTELVNPHVQRHGEVAVLTFNLRNHNTDGSVTDGWNSTEVYCRIDGRWRIIHSHWSITTPGKP